MGARRLDIDWPAELARAAKDGIHAAALARQLGVSDYSVSKARAQYGVELPRGRCGIAPKADWERVLPLYAAEGLTLLQVAARTGVTKPAVIRHCKRLGIRLKGQFPLQQQGRAA